MGGSLRGTGSSGTFRKPLRMRFVKIHQGIRAHGCRGRTRRDIGSAHRIAENYFITIGKTSCPLGQSPCSPFRIGTIAAIRSSFDNGYAGLWRETTVFRKDAGNKYSAQDRKECRSSIDTGNSEIEGRSHIGKYSPATPRGIDAGNQKGFIAPRIWEFPPTTYYDGQNRFGQSGNRGGR